MGEFDDALRCGAHQCGVAIALVRTQHIAQLLRHGDRDVEVGACQKLGFARSDPALGLILMASGTAPVLARMVGEDLSATAVAAPEVPAELLGPAGEDIGNGTPMRRQHRRAMGRQIVPRKAAQNIRERDHYRPL